MILLLGIQTREFFCQVHERTCMRMFMAVWLVVGGAGGKIGVHPGGMERYGAEDARQGILHSHQGNKMDVKEDKGRKRNIQHGTIYVD